MIVYSRKCPNCHKLLVYSCKDSLANSIRRHTVCGKCASIGGKFKRPRTQDEKNRISAKLKNRYFSPEHKKRISESLLGHTVSTKTRHILSVHTKGQWKAGMHKCKFTSKGELELGNIIESLGVSVKRQYLVGGTPFDIYISDANLLLEFNGTYWHLDPRKYSLNYLDKSRNVTSQYIWNKDMQKLNVAKLLGYKTAVVWQFDWENSPDKLQLVQNLIDTH